MGSYTFPDKGIVFTVGSDPEVFAIDSKGQVIPAFKWLPSQTSRANKLAPFWDGFQAEYNVLPYTCHQNLQHALRTGLQETYQAIKKYDKTATLTYDSVLPISPKLMESVSDTEAALGCSPSINIYPDVEQLFIPDGRELPIRFAGFHVHHGLTQYGLSGKKEIENRVRMMDRMGSVILTSLLEGLEDPRRRMFYGRAGEHRLPAHGLEYRVPPSAALVHPVVTIIALDVLRQAGNFASKGLLEAWKCEGDTQTQHIINTSDVEQARSVMKDNKDTIKSFIKVNYDDKGYNPDANQSVEKLIYQGAKSLLPTNLVENWALTDDVTWTGYDHKIGKMVTPTLKYGMHLRLNI